MRPSRFLILIAIGAAVAAFLYTYVSHAAAAVFTAIAAAPLIPRPAFRFLAALFFLIATVALVSDLTPLLLSGDFLPTPLAAHWEEIGPSTLVAAQTAIANSSAPWLWDHVIIPIIAWPTFVLFGVLALACGYAGRRRHEVNIYVN